MAESHAVVLLLGLVAACMVALTAVLLKAVGDLRRALRKLQRFLSHCDQTRLQAERTLGVARQLLSRADRAAGRVQGVVEKSCDAAESALEQFSILKGKVVSLWAGRAGNGGSHPRSRIVHRTNGARSQTWHR